MHSANRVLEDCSPVPLSATFEELCESALTHMADSNDVAHDDQHVTRMLQDAQDFATSSESDTYHFDWEVLVSVICWHDTWRSRHTPRTNLLTFLLDQWWDGIGSALQLRKYLAKNNTDISQPRKKKMVDAVIKHGGVVANLRKPKTNEAKLLKDLDYLEFFSIERLQALEQFGRDNNLINGATYRVAKYFFEHSMIKVKEDTFYFAWSRQAFMNRRTKTFRYLSQRLATLQAEFGL